MDYTKFDEYIGEQLYVARATKHLTLSNMAELLTAKLIINNDKRQNVSLQGYQCYEKGTRSIPNQVLKYACEILKLDTFTVIKNAGEKYIETIEKYCK